MHETILSKIEYYATHSPNKICLIEASSGKQITYEEFWSEILRYAKDTQTGKRYILQTRQTIAHLVSFYGVQAAGSTAIPVEGTATEERLAELSEQFDAEILPVEYTLGNVEKTFVNPEWEDIACIICTTGTTGKSKGVMSSFRCRFSGADNVRYSYEISDDDVALVPQMLSHSGGLRRVEAMLVSGATTVIMGAAMLYGSIFGAIQKYNCNILQFVPAQIAQILQRAEKLLLKVAPQIRIISVGSAVIPESDKERLRELLPGVRLFNDFGSTEAIGSSYFEWSAFPPKPGCVGVESLHSKIIFLDDELMEMDETSADNPGTIATCGDTLMTGYYNNPCLTEKVLNNGRMISSDLGYRGQDGMVYILGRKDDMIVCGANKIAPSEIEDAVLKLDSVKECACVPKKDDIMGQMPALFVAWNSNSISKELLIKELEKTIDKYKIPRSENIFFIDALPRTIGTGKVIKRELVEMLNCD